jgi:adenine-specific DNA-methyltransferase
MNWGVTPGVAERLLRNGYLRAGRAKRNEPQKYVISYLTDGIVQDIEAGVAVLRGRNPDGTVDAFYPAGRDKMPTTNWNRPSHDAQQYGTKLLNALLSNRPFPYPKSLYAVEDALRFFVGGKPTATILDFFAGSGTTAHAVMRLNKQDGGSRQCITVTNNEVAAKEQEALRKKGLRPGDAEWERLGICDYITKPRVQAAITGKTPDDDSIKGDYKFTDEFPMSEGFKENAEFFTLTYETPLSVNHNLAFARIAPLLWLRASSSGKRIDELPVNGWAVADSYALLVDVDSATPFVNAVSKAQGLRIAFIVTDDDRQFQSIARRLPEGVEPVRLYESYLTNFSFANGE